MFYQLQNSFEKKGIVNPSKTALIQGVPINMGIQ